MVNIRLRWFEHVEWRPVDSIVRRLDQIEGIQIVRDRGKPRKTIEEDLEKL